MKVHKHIKRQGKKGKVYNVEQKIIYVPSRAKVGEEVYILTPEELQEILNLIPEKKRPKWLVME